MGDSISDKKLVEAILNFNFDCPKTIDFLLNEPAKIISTSSKNTKLAQQTIEKGNTFFI